LLLFGEHAAVYGFPALGIGLPWNTTVTLEEHQGLEWLLPDLLPEEDRNLRTLLVFFQEAFPYFRRLGSMRLSIDSEVPTGMGFGSSAALCVAFLRALMTVVAGRMLPDRLVRELARSFDFLWDMANRAERLFHGKPSGVDTGLSLLGHPHSFRFGSGALPTPKRLPATPFYLVVGGLPRCGNTKELVGRIAEGFHAGGGVRSRIERLGEIADEAGRVFSSRRGEAHAARLGRLADRAHEVLAGLGLSTDDLEDVLESGRRAGASGGKLSGAGGGGAFYLIAPGLEQARLVRDAVRAAFTRLGYGAESPLAVFESGKRGILPAD
jgi:mevalonate kinase